MVKGCKESIYIALYMKEQIISLAEKEGRGFSGMVRVLLLEALSRREARDE